MTTHCDVPGCDMPAKHLNVCLFSENGDNCHADRNIDLCALHRAEAARQNELSKDVRKIPGDMVGCKHWEGRGGSKA